MPTNSSCGLVEHPRLRSVYGDQRIIRIDDRNSGVDVLHDRAVEFFAVAQRLLGPPVLRLSIQALQAERNRRRGFLKQGDLLVLKDMRLIGVDRQRPADLFVKPDRQRRCGEETVRGRGRLPRRRARVGKKVVEDGRLVLADARANRTATLRPIVGVDFDLVEITLVVASAGDGVDRVRPGVSQADPDELEARLLGNDSADFAEQFVARLDADDGLVQQAEGRVEPVQPFGLPLVGLALGDVAEETDQPPAARGQIVHARLRMEQSSVLTPMPPLEPGGAMFPNVLYVRSDLGRSLIGLHITNGHPEQFLPAVAGQLAVRLVDFQEAPVGIQEAEAVHRGAQDGCQLLATLLQAGLGLVLVEGHLDGRAQFPVLERLDDVAERLGHLGPLQRRVAHERGQEHDRDRQPLPDRLGRGDAVHFTRQVDIHQHQVGAQLVGQGEGLLSPWRLGHRLIAQERQLLGDVPGHDGFAFHDENSRLTHGAPPTGLAVCGVKTNSHTVPGPRPISSGPWSWPARSVVRAKCRPAHQSPVPPSLLQSRPP